MKYIKVGIGVERHWKSAVFTYAATQQLNTGSIVRVPFGTKKRVGVVLETTARPSFETKEIYEDLSLSLSQQTLNFINWFKSFYVLSDGETYSQFFPNYISTSKRLSENLSKVQAEIDLNKTQINAVEEIQKHNRPVVLQGVTGSGKTRVYSKLIQENIKNNKNSLVLYPEIALTKQLVNELEKLGPVLVFHSHLTNKERSELWQKVAAYKEPTIIAGPRSALFLPHRNLGLIILDEAHDGSYHQENDVRYNGLFVAGGLAKAHSAKLVLGSATPPLLETELILRNGGEIIHMNEKAIASTFQTTAEVIDLKNRDLFKKHPLLATALLEAVQASIDHGKQALLFLNRRGTAKLLLCEACTWQQDCMQCDLPMTYHHDLHKMICHTCGEKAEPKTSCLMCGARTSMRSFGSKALVEEVQKLFPNAKIARFDSDTTKKDSFNEVYEKVRSGDIDILIGTQQITKGLDLPKLETIGVLQADLSLHFPDYTSNERTFQLLAQVFGRVGRGHGNGKIFIQTYQPNNPLVHFALSEDWEGFRDSELSQRKKHLFPPYTFHSKIIVRDKNIQKAKINTAKLSKSIQDQHPSLTVRGPVPSFHAKRGGFYYIQLHLSSSSRADILKAVKDLPDWAIKELDPSTLL